MIQISPQETYPIVYKLSDPNETDTYYVRAVVRNSVTGAILQTVNLTDLGSGRFSESVQAPNDPSGLGLYIDVTVTVYSDSAYTTKNQKYSDVLYPYLVQTRINHSTAGGGGGLVVNAKEGQTGIDYEKIKQMLLEALDGLPKDTKQPVDITPIMQGIHALMTHIEANKPKPAEPVDLTEFFSRFDDLESMIEEKPVTPPTDLTELHDKIDSIDIPDRDYTGAFNKITELLTELKDIVPQQKYNTFIDALTESMSERPTKKPQKAGVDDRISKLMSA